MNRIRRRLRCIGAVQGVGFRPTMHRLAREFALHGRVWNDAGGATVEVEGPAAAVEAFVQRVPEALPRLARLDGFSVEAVAPDHRPGFFVEESTDGARAGALVPPDSALCPACAADMAEPSNRRYRYPFTTCTDCGPRYSLALSLPYDRDRTTMACFPLCPACRSEYEDPGDRRFHAEPVCCPACGPRLWLTDPDGAVLGEAGEAIGEAAKRLLDGVVVAVKGLGGFQLACLADQASTVQRLRERKRRPSKPFAVMAADVERALEWVDLGPDGVDALASPRAPIVLGPKRPDTPVVADVAPGLDDLGVLLPTTPVHVLLAAACGRRPLVMTSGNASDEPICRANREALERLAGIADAFLFHDRDVARRVDDSVQRTAPGGPILLRRARGWVPEPCALPRAAPAPMLAVGGHLQVAAAIAQDRSIQTTPHVGDQDGEPARAALAEAIGHLEDLLQVRPALILADAHPDYPSTWLAERLAEERSGRLVRIQHHLAHAGALFAEHGVDPTDGTTALVIALDGTGWGPDGTSWGGEWLLVDPDLGWRRVGRLEPIAMVGGEAAVREPWRIATAALAAQNALDRLDDLPLAAMVDPDHLHQVARLAVGGAWPETSGAGRLFEACGALLGLAPVNGYEGEAAMLLESVACAGRAEVWEIPHDGSSPQLSGPALLAEAARRCAAGEPKADIAASFHATFCTLAGTLTRRLAAAHGAGFVAAGGGCLVNRLLRSGLPQATGRDVALPTRIPPGDGGLSAGQATMGVLATAHQVDPSHLVRPVEDVFQP